MPRVRRRLVLGCEGCDGVAVKNVDIGAFRDIGDARISGGYDQAVAFGVLFDSPCDAVFASAAAQY